MAWNEPGGNENDPWGNNRRNPGGGPPDLDEVFGNLKKRAEGLFGGGRRGGSGGSGGAKFSGPSASLMGLIGAIALGIWLISGIYVVQPAESGVITQFGRYVRSVGPGPHWHLPYPFQAVEKVDVEQIQSAKLKNQIILTSDENLVDANITILYRVNDAANYLFKVEDPGNTVSEAAESALREVVGQNSMDFVITSERDQISSATRQRLQEILDEYSAGIEITSINADRLQPPAEVNAAFLDAIKAREDKERFINEATAYANEVLPIARGDAQSILEVSEAYKTRVVQAATGESQRFIALLDEYQKAPRVTRDRLYLETMEDVFSSTGKVLMDDSGGGGNSLMYLPIDKLMQGGTVRPSTDIRGGAESALGASSTLRPEEDLAPSLIEPTRTNDLRSRSRESR